MNRRSWLVRLLERLLDEHDKTVPDLQWRDRDTCAAAGHNCLRPFDCTCPCHDHARRDDDGMPDENYGDLEEAS